MSVTCIIQARMGSTRFPGKVLSDLGGRPLLQFMLERLSFLKVDHLVVATSDLVVDDSVAEAAVAAGAEVARGSEEDVLDRFATTLKLYPADVVVRLTADCPLMDPKIVEAAMRLKNEKKANYVSNTLVRTYPDGLDVEVVDFDTLMTAVAESADPTEREHVTPFIYRHPERFRLIALRNDKPLGDERWTVDTQDDLDFVRDLGLKLAGRWPSDWREILAIAGQRASPPKGSLYLRPAMPPDAPLLFAWRNDPRTVATSRTKWGVSKDEHERWFAERLEGPASRIWIGEVDGKPVGQVRIDVQCGEGEVSIGVASESRGQGYGHQLLGLLHRALLSDYQVQRLIAEVRRGNEASLKSFLGTGYKIESTGTEFVRLRWDRRT